MQPDNDPNNPAGQSLRGLIKDFKATVMLLPNPAKERDLKLSKIMVSNYHCGLMSVRYNPRLARTTFLS